MTIHSRLLALTLPPLQLNARLYQSILIMVMLALGLAIAWLPLIEALLLFGGVAVLILLLIKPILSLYLLIPLIPFSGWLAVSWGSFKAGLMEIVLALGIMAWLLQIVVRRNLESQPRTLKLRAGPLGGPLVLFLGGVGLSWLNTLSIGASSIETLKWVEALLLYLFIINLLPARHIKWVITALLIAGVAQAVLGLYQFIFKVGPEGFLLFGGRFLRAYGAFAQPNPYAGYLGLALPLVLSLIVWAFVDSKGPPRSKVSSLQLKIFLSLAFGLLLAALFATQSRGAWVGFATAAVVTLAIRSRNSAAIFTAIALAGAVIGLIGSFDLNVTKINTTSVITQRFIDAIAVATVADISTIEVDDANFATIERLAHWQAAREMWRDNLWLGVGFGNYAVVYPAYAVGRWLDPLGHAHNYLLNIGAEAGLVGIIAYLIFWIFVFRVIWLTIRQSQGFDKAVAIGGLGILIHLHIHNLFDNLYVQGMYLHVIIILALISIIFRYNFNQLYLPTGALELCKAPH